MDIIDDLKDLHKQATTERSHYYVANCVTRSIEEIEKLRKERDELFAVNGDLANRLGRQNLRLMAALREIRDFPYVGTQASQKIATIARAALNET